MQRMALADLVQYARLVSQQLNSRVNATEKRDQTHQQMCV
jgi:hypothetical protein